MKFGPRFALAFALPLAACGSDTIDDRFGDFSVAFDADTNALRIRHASGLALDTTPGALAAFRKSNASYEHLYGSFKIEETTDEPWVFAAGIRDVDKTRDALSASLIDTNDRVIGTLRVRTHGSSLMVAIESSREEANRAATSFGCDQAGGYLGFGAQTHDVDHRGQIVPVFVSEQGIGKVDTDEYPLAWQLVGTRHQAYLSVPTLVAPRAVNSFGLHATTFHRSIWDVCATDPSALRIEAWEGKLEIVVSAGPTPLAVIEQQTEHNGRVPLGPDWTFGVWMEKVGGSDAVREEVAKLRRHRIPVSAIWSEDWRGATRQGTSYVLEEDWRWDEVLYPNLPGLIDDLHDAGVKFQVYFNTFISNSADVWDEAHSGGHFVVDRDGEPYIFDGVKFEPTGLADLFQDKTRAWVQGELTRALALGIDGWMADYAEWYPADRRTVSTSDGSDPEAAHHRYPVAWAELNREAVNASGRDDVVIFHRSGYTGSQGKAHVVWAGDQRTSFQTDDGLPTIIPILMGLAATGFPVVCHDIAGYASATNDPTTKDLFFRWTSLGALAPIMRTHHGRDADLNWRWDRDGETIAHFRRWSVLHTRLFPTWKGLARDAAATGAPIVRPVALYAPSEVALHGTKDTYMIGDAILVAPVVTASTARRRVELPAGSWFDWLSGDKVSGSIDVQVPLTELPMFARAGAIVPLLPDGVQSLVATSTTVDLDDVRWSRVVRVYLGADGAMSEGEGGRYSLASNSEVSAPVTVTGATQIDGGANGLTADATVGTDVVISDAAGGTHTFRMDGIHSRMAVRLEVRW